MTAQNKERALPHTTAVDQSLPAIATAELRRQSWRSTCGVLLAAGMFLSSCAVQTTLAPAPEPAQEAAAIAPAQPFPTADYVAVSAQEPPQALSEPLVISDFWFHLRKDMHLPLHLEHRRVQQELAWLKRHPRYLHRLQDRMQTYLPYIYREVVLNNQPAELALLPIVESALDVYAFSHGGAAGPWQFVRGTARQYGLTIDDWYDGRRDIIASTNAALDYLGYLHQRYDDWYLALAGYNAGQGNVDRARRKKPSADYFELALPRETRAYVPRLLALAAVIKEPERYGLTLPPIENELQFAEVDIHGQFQIDKLIAASGLSAAEFTQWNPAYARWATSPKGPHHIVLPTALDLEEIQVKISEIPATERVDWQEIKVRPGDTLSGLASRYNTDTASLKRANQLRDSRLRAGRKLLIPVAGADTSQPPTLAASSEGLSHTVLAGESLWTIAKQYQVSLRKLMISNQIGPKDPLSIGRKLTIPGQHTSNKVVRTVRYKVRRGDSLARIASKFNVSIKQIASWNRLDPNRYLQPGQGLVLHVNVVGG